MGFEATKPRISDVFDSTSEVTIYLPVGDKRDSQTCFRLKRRDEQANESAIKHCRLKSNLWRLICHESSSNDFSKSNGLGVGFLSRCSLLTFLRGFTAAQSLR